MKRSGLQMGMISSVEKNITKLKPDFLSLGEEYHFCRDGHIKLKQIITTDTVEIINTLRNIYTLEETTVERKNLEITETYVKPEMDVIEVSSEYAIITEGCGSCAMFEPEENEGPFFGDF